MKRIMNWKKVLQAADSPRLCFIHMVSGGHPWVVCKPPIHLYVYYEYKQDINKIVFLNVCESVHTKNDLVLEGIDLRPCTLCLNLFQILFHIISLSFDVLW